MTNAEKFYEVFGTRGWVDWDAEYKGTPTIPLSVIEKIKAEIPRYAFGWNGKEDLVRTDRVLEIIDRKVNEVDR